MSFFKHAVLAALSVSMVAGCTSGGGDDDGDGGGVDLRNNACSVIGLNSKIGDLSEKIINGTECESETTSPVVRIVFFEGQDASSLCSGTMITTKHVITAAHCFDDTSRSLGIVIDGTLFPARKVSVHPDFRRNGEAFGVPADFNDVAVIELTRDINLPVVPILTSRKMQNDDVVAIFGYGTDENGDLGVLKSGEMQLDGVSSDHLLSIFDGKDGSNTCTGDSGGPSIYQFNGRAALVGVTSSGTVEGCLEGDNSLFTNLQTASNLDFVLDAAPGAQTF